MSLANSSDYVENSPVLYQVFEVCVLAVGSSILGRGLKRGIIVDLTKIKAVMRWLRPKTVTEVRSFFRMVSYYRRVFQDF